MEPLPVKFGHRETQKPDGSTGDGWHAFTCGHCGRDVSACVIAYAPYAQGGVGVRWLQCPICRNGSVESAGGAAYPGALFGPKLSGLPDDVAAAYEEARRCLAVNANTASEGMCRKILMHVAVDKGAKEGEKFEAYLQHLQSKGYVTPPMKGWVRLIREHGNKSQHRLPASDRKRAEGTVLFTAQLLRIVYEMEHMAAEFVPAPEATTAPPAAE